MALVWLLLLGSTARADFVFLFTDSGGNPQSKFTANPGDALTVKVFLAQGPGEGRLADPNNGLFGGGVRLEVNGTLPAHPAQFNSVADLTANTSQFDVTTTQLDSSTNGFVAVAAFNFPNVSSSQIFLGSFTFHVPSNALSNEVTSFTTALPGGQSGDNILGDGTIIDGNITNATATITVNPSGGSVTPEPGSLVLGSIGLATLLGYGWRARWWARRKDNEAGLAG
jgi:hypothetical protein